MGTIEGTIVYKADPKRRWRFGRYYIKDSRKGQLAESVVALRGKALKSSDADRTLQTHVIDQKDFQFVPQTSAIHAGDSVTITNSDPSTHNVNTSGSLANFNISTPFGGQSTHRLDRAGGIRRPVEVGCVFHGSMRAWIFVFDHPHHLVTGTDGAFRFENVPPGEYFLEMTHPAGGLRWRKRVEVKSGGTLRVDVEVSPDDLIDK